MDNRHKSIHEIQAQVQIHGGVSSKYFHFQSGWGRVYIVDRDGYTIGRMSFRDKVFYSLKIYKPDTSSDIDESDRILMGIQLWLYNGISITDDLFYAAEKKAEEKRLADMEACARWREMHPLNGVTVDKRNGKTKPRKRKALKGKNVRHILLRLLQTLPADKV